MLSIVQCDTGLCAVPIPDFNALCKAPLLALPVLLRPRHHRPILICVQAQPVQSRNQVTLCSVIPGLVWPVTFLPHYYVRALFDVGTVDIQHVPAVFATEMPGLQAPLLSGSPVRKLR